MQNIIPLYKIFLQQLSTIDRTPPVKSTTNTILIYMHTTLWQYDYIRLSIKTDVEGINVNALCLLLNVVITKAKWSYAVQKSKTLSSKNSSSFFFIGDPTLQTSVWMY